MALEVDGTVLKTLVVTDLVDSTRLTEELGDNRVAEIFARQDRLARDWMERTSGIEIDKTDGFLIFFDRPIEAVEFSLGYHRALAELSEELGIQVETRVGIHLGEVVVRKNSPEDIARGANDYEVEGLAKPLTARLMSLAQGRQTILSRSAFDVARRAAVGREAEGGKVLWLAHGLYLLKGMEDPIEVFEAGIEGFSPLTPPHDSSKVKRAGESGKVLGWHPAAGQEIPQRPRWLVESKLGEGGFGEVWLARHEKTGKRRVFKFCYEKDHLRALQREVTLFRLLKEDLGDRSDINRILDWNFEKPPYFIEAEYTASGSLKEWAANKGGLETIPLETRLGIVVQTAEALAAAHSVGVLHKDIKPENILVREDQQGPHIRITDFGIGAITNESRLAEAGITVVGLTEDVLEEATTGSGTLLYMAPELLEGRPATVQADIYALGVLLYQMVAGSFSLSLAPGWERDVEDELLREDISFSVDRSPQRRLGNALRIAERLQNLETRRKEREAEREARVREERSRRRRKLAWLAAGVSSALLIVMAVFLVIVYREQKRAEKNLQLAKAAVDQMLTEVGSETLDDVPQMEEVRRVLLSKARDFYEEFQQQEPTAPDLSMEIQVDRFHLDTALAHRRLGEICRLEGKIACADQEYQKAIEILTTMVQTFPDVIEYRKELASTYDTRGELLRGHQKDADEALASYQAALDIQKQLVKQFPDQLDLRHELGRTYNNRGIVLERTDLKLAEESYREAIEILKSVVASDEQGNQQPEYLLELSRAYNNLGSLIAVRDDTSEARWWLEKSVEALEKLVASQPDKRQFQQELAIRYKNFAYFFYLQDEGEAAHDQNRKALQLFESLSWPLPALTAEHAHALWVEGVLLRAKGQEREAQEVFRRSIELSRQLRRDDSGYAGRRTFRQRFAWTRWVESPVTVTELAGLAQPLKQEICNDYAWLVRELSPQDLLAVIGATEADQVASILSRCGADGADLNNPGSYYRESVEILEKKFNSGDKAGS